MRLKANDVKLVNGNILKVQSSHFKNVNALSAYPLGEMMIGELP